MRYQQRAIVDHRVTWLNLYSLEECFLFFRENKKMAGFLWGTLSIYQGQLGSSTIGNRRLVSRPREEKRNTRSAHVHSETRKNVLSL
jgi:hypothetical protein